MKPSELILDSLYKFTETQKTAMENLSTRILSLRDKKIGMDTFNEISNCMKELESIRENVITRLLSSMKRGDMVS
jgi:hypothetical protein